MDGLLKERFNFMDRKKLGLLICFAAILMFMPMVMSFTAISKYQVYVLEGAMIWGIYAISYNLLLGYTGLLSFGHALLLGSGAYTVALVMNYTGIQSCFLLILISVGVAALVSMAVGALCVRYTSIYFTMLTLAFAQLGVFLLTTSKFNISSITGGTDGLKIGAPALLGLKLKYTWDFAVSQLYYVVVGLFILTILIFYLIINSLFGKTIQAIRENPTRVRFLGLSVIKYRWMSFVISGAFAGMAGALTVMMFGSITPNMIGFLASSEIVLTVILGGAGFFSGPIIGAFAYKYLGEIAQGAKWLPFNWKFMVGGIIIAVVLLFRRGIGGELELRLKKWL